MLVKMNKILFMILCIILLTSCSGENQDKENVTTIHMSIFEFDPNGTLEEARQRFNQQHDTIQVEFIKMSNDATHMHDQTASQLQSGESDLDIVNLDVIWTAEFAEAGWIEPLAMRFNDDMQAKFVGRQVDAVTYDGEVWAVPWLNDLHTMWYRRDLLDKYGLEVPTTYEEAVHVARFIQENEEMKGFSMNWGQSEQLMVSFTEFLHANGGAFFDDDGHVTIDRPQAIEALQFMIDMKNEYNVVTRASLENQIPEDARQPFAKNETLFHPNWSYTYMANQSNDSLVQDQTWVASNPAMKHGKKTNTVGGWNFAIVSDSEHKDAAWQVIKWFTSFETQKQMILNNGPVGTRLVLYKDQKIVEQNPQLEEYLKAFEHAAVRPVHPKYSLLSDQTQYYIHQALTGQLTAEKALHQLAEQLKHLNTTTDRSSNELVCVKHGMSDRLFASKMDICVKQE